MIFSRVGKSSFLPIGKFQEIEEVVFPYTLMRLMLKFTLPHLNNKETQYSSDEAESISSDVEEVSLRNRPIKGNNPDAVKGSIQLEKDWDKMKKGSTF